MKSLALDFSKDKQQMNWQNFLKVIRRDLWLLPITPWGQVPTQTVVQSNFSFEKWANQLQIYTNKIAGFPTEFPMPNGFWSLLYIDRFEFDIGPRNKGWFLTAGGCFCGETHWGHDSYVNI